MIQRAVSVAIAMLLIATFSAPAPVAATATTRTVCASGCDYTTIQSAVSAASAGDTIQVQAGTYAEQVVISKDITVTGAGEEVTVIQSPATLASVCGTDLASYANSVAIVDVCGSSANVTISGLTIDGDGDGGGPLSGMPASGRSEFYGLVVHGGATATITSITVTNVHQANPASWGQQAGRAVWVGPTSTLIASSLHVLRYQKSGIFASGSSSAVANLTLTDSLVEGDQLTGMNSSIAMNGITIIGATATLVGVTSRGNQCDHVSCSFAGYNSGGLLIYDRTAPVPAMHVSVSDSIFEDNDWGIYTRVRKYESSVEISSNDISANRHVGLEVNEGNAAFNNNDITNNGIVGIELTSGIEGVAPVLATFVGNIVKGNGGSDPASGGVRLIEKPTYPNRATLLFTRNAIIENTGVTFAHLSSLTGEPLETLGVITGTGTWWGVAGQPGDVSGEFTANLANVGLGAMNTDDQTYGLPLVANAITWTQPLSGRVGRADLSLTASALTAVSYLAADETICTIVDGTKVHFVAAGTCTVSAAAGADATYLAAAGRSKSFTVVAAFLSNAITWTQSLSGRVGSADLALTATAATTVSYVSNTLGVCTIVSRKVHFVSAGECTVTAAAGANATYQAAEPSIRSFTVLVAYLPNAITWTQSLSGRVGTADLDLTATALTAVSYLAADETICTIVDGTKVHFVAAGTCTVSAAAGADATYLAAAGRSKSFTVVAAFLSNAITWTQSLSGRVGSADLALTATAATTVSYVSNTLGVCTIVSRKVHFVSAGECTVTAAAGANATYQAAEPSIRSFTVLVAYLPNTITWRQVFGTQRVGTADLTLTATALTAVSYVSTNEAICTIVDGTKVHFVSAGTCTISAAAGADVTYRAAAGRSKSFTVFAARP